MGGFIYGDKNSIRCFRRHRRAETKAARGNREPSERRGCIDADPAASAGNLRLFANRGKTIIAEEMDIPLEKVYGVVTFYSQFSLYPKGKYKMSVCLGTACYVKGSGDVYSKLIEKLGIEGGECTADGKFSLEACRCIGACGLAPVLTVNDDVYGRLTVDDVDKILEKYN